MDLAVLFLFYYLKADGYLADFSKEFHLDVGLALVAIHLLDVGLHAPEWTFLHYDFVTFLNPYGYGNKGLVSAEAADEALFGFRQGEYIFAGSNQPGHFWYFFKVLDQFPRVFCYYEEIAGEHGLLFPVPASSVPPFGFVAYDVAAAIASGRHDFFYEVLYLLFLTCVGLHGVPHEVCFLSAGGILRMLTQQRAGPFCLILPLWAGYLLPTGFLQRGRATIAYVLYPGGPDSTAPINLYMIDKRGGKSNLGWKMGTVSSSLVFLQIMSVYCII